MKKNRALELTVVASFMNIKYCTYTSIMDNVKWRNSVMSTESFHLLGRKYCWASC